MNDICHFSDHFISVIMQLLFIRTIFNSSKKFTVILRDWIVAEKKANY